MARGYPDFLSYPQFDQFGPWQYDEDLMRNIASGNTETALTINDPGKLSSCMISFNNIVEETCQVHPLITLDGIQRKFERIGTIFALGIHQIGDYPIRMVYWYWDGSGLVVHGLLNPSISWGRSFSIAWENDDDDAILCDIRMWWRKLEFSG